jgi:hypothetical protein
MNAALNVEQSHKASKGIIHCDTTGNTATTTATADVDVDAAAAATETMAIATATATAESPAEMESAELNHPNNLVASASTSHELGLLGTASDAIDSIDAQMQNPLDYFDAIAARLRAKRDELAKLETFITQLKGKRSVFNEDEIGGAEHLFQTLQADNAADSAELEAKLETYTNEIVKGQDIIHQRSTILDSDSASTVFSTHPGLLELFVSGQRRHETLMDNAKKRVFGD